jgi:hypothetical protein
MITYLPLYVLAVAAALALVIWVPRWLMLRRVGRKAPMLSDLPCLGDRDDGDALLYFYSPRCSHCRPVAEAVDLLARRGTYVVRVDVSRCAQAARRFGIREIPAVVSVARGRITGVMIGPYAARALTAGAFPPPRPA